MSSVQAWQKKEEVIAAQDFINDNLLKMICDIGILQSMSSVLLGLRSLC